MKNLDNLNEKPLRKKQSKAHKLFSQYFKDFDFNSIPYAERTKDVGDYAEIYNSSKKASEAPIDGDSVIEDNQ